MSSRYPIGRGVRLEVNNVIGSAKTVSAITAANPGVVTSTSHALAAGSVGYLSGVTGMTALEGQAVRVDDPVTNEFELELIDTTDLGTFSGTCSFFPVTSWHTVGNAIDVNTTGGQSADVDESVLLDDLQQLAAGPLSAQQVQVSSRSAFQTAAMLAIEAAAFAGDALVWRVTLKDGQQRVFRGTPSVPDENIGLGQSVTSGFSIKVTGRVVRLPAL